MSIQVSRFASSERAKGDMEVIAVVVKSISNTASLKKDRDADCNASTNFNSRVHESTLHGFTGATTTVREKDCQRFTSIQIAFYECDKV